MGERRDFTNPRSRIKVTTDFPSLLRLLPDGGQLKAMVNPTRWDEFLSSYRERIGQGDYEVNAAWEFQLGGTGKHERVYIRGLNFRLDHSQGDIDLRHFDIGYRGKQSLGIKDLRQSFEIFTAPDDYLDSVLTRPRKMVPEGFMRSLALPCPTPPGTDSLQNSPQSILRLRDQSLAIFHRLRN